MINFDKNQALKLHLEISNDIADKVGHCFV